ncbi:MAG: cobyrinate a,c-diamide synthase [Methanomicrobiales archaeon]|nr:cobyrinate a,c-diamide synthase [Methanomicrobiales archaeon]MDI6876437.1 cobyrinate a,c-diamide synthase [Methanomicrobiales archaeon]
MNTYGSIGMIRIPRIVVAGTHSGCGKTTVASGLMAALAARGLHVQPFKVGPDFIDPTHHTAICGRHSRNLDPYMMGRKGVEETFAAAVRGADIAVIEGVMGLYDGMDGSETSSTAEVAKILQAPVVLVIDARGMSRSIHAVVRGYAGFDPATRIAGVILNRVGSERHRRSIEPALEIPALGWIPRRTDLSVQSRHLGLAMAHESGKMSLFGRIIEETCDLEGIVKVAGTAPPLPGTDLSAPLPEPDVQIGVARDEAFCFYYPDNLERLAAAGAGVRFFSPIRDSLPAVDLIYLGGGYPELHAAALERSPCTKEIRKAADGGMPIYGECGGLLYLTGGLDAERFYRFGGILPAHSVMEDRIQGLGYVEASVRQGTDLLPSDLAYRGHEFHYSRVECGRDARFAVSLQRGTGIERGRDGLFVDSVMGCYTHAYFSTDFAEALVAAARRFQRR